VCTLTKRLLLLNSLIDAGGEGMFTVLTGHVYGVYRAYVYGVYRAYVYGVNRALFTVV